MSPVPPDPVPARIVFSNTDGSEEFDQDSKAAIRAAAIAAATPAEPDEEVAPFPRRSRTSATDADGSLAAHRQRVSREQTSEEEEVSEEIVTPHHRHAPAAPDVAPVGYASRPPPRARMKMSVSLAGLGSICVDVVEVLKDADGGSSLAVIYDTTSGNKFEPVHAQEYDIVVGEEKLHVTFTGMKLAFEHRPWAMLVFLIPRVDDAPGEQ